MPTVINEKYGLVDPRKEGFDVIDLDTGEAITLSPDAVDVFYEEYPSVVPNAPVFNEDTIMEEREARRQTFNIPF